jgi:hypothetical protein
MKRYSLATMLGAGALMGGLGAGATVAACSSSTASGGGGGTGNDGGNNNGQPGSCANPTLPVSFSPMFSAFVNDTTTHQFQIPAIVDGASGFTWSSSDPSKVKLTPDPTTGGVMITMQGQGTVNIFATAADGTCGASALSITAATESDWATGNARYNDGNSIHFGRRDGGADSGDVTPDAGPACTSCHGPTATNGPFNDVAHTPEQTGGFSDQELIDIVVNGTVPDGGYFDPNVILPDASGDPVRTARAYGIWQRFHKWTDITPDQQKGIVVYLRSITPAPQDGTSNFGGGGRDGGRRDGGPRGDGGGPPGNDSGTSDAADQ